MSHSTISEAKREQDLDLPVLKSIEYEAVDERKTMRYIDFRIIPILAAIYAFSLIDRNNLSTARVAGMGTELKLQIGNRYSILSSIYLIPYILLQIPGNAILRRVGVKYWITFITVSWGAVVIGMGFVKHWGFIVLCRILLGIFEAGYFPSIIFIVSTWYRRHEVQKRLAGFYLSASIVSGFGNALAYALTLLDGQKNIAGWSWIFIIEGAVTIALGVLAYFVIPEFPDRNTFLTKAQTAFVLMRIEEDRGDSIPDEITVHKILHHLTDWTIWMYGIMFACVTLPTYMMAFFVPIILKGLNFSTADSLLLSSPPYGAAFVAAVIFAYLSDKWKHRAGFIVMQNLLTLIGCCMTSFAKGVAPRYAGTFFIAMGALGNVPSILAWGANNIVSHSKRSVQSAVITGCGGIGGVLASTVFREQDSPRYIPGLCLTIAAQVVCIIIVGILSFHFNRLNRLSREGKLEKPLEGRVGFLYTP